jgi:hypothetical protein
MKKTTKWLVTVVKGEIGTHGVETWIVRAATAEAAVARVTGRGMAVRSVVAK